MKRVLLFLVLGSSAVALLLHFAGGLAGPRQDQPQPVVESKETRPEPAGHKINPGRGLPQVERIKGITQFAPPETLVWKDRLSDETLEIPGFIPWRFHAADVAGIQPADAQHQGVRCTKVEFLVYRPPATRAEALALHQSAEGAHDPLLHQRFRANEARVYGRLADRLRRHRTPTQPAGGHQDTTIRLSGAVRIIDSTQGLDITGEDLTLWPDQERASGRGDFTVRHEAFVLTGDGLTMERLKEKGWSRVAILRNPVLRIESDLRNEQGRPVFDFGPGDFKPAHISSEGRAILVREETRRETIITVTFTDRVRAEQVGGRTLDAGRLEFTAVRHHVPPRSVQAVPDSNWKLQHFQADKHVSVEYPSRTRKGEAYVTSVTADRLIHDVPVGGRPQTLLEGDPVIVMRGQIPLLGPGGRLRASCRDRAWIGPVPADLPNSGLDPDRLQHIALRGQARIEHDSLENGHTQDILEGDEIDLVVFPEKKSKGQSAAAQSGERMVAIYFAALGDVRLGGTRIRGSTHRVIAEDLHKERPHVTAEGEGSHYQFPDLGKRERLLGPEPRTARAGADAGDSSADAESDTKRAKKGQWLLNRIHADGDVVIDTSLGGPALGIPAHVSGNTVTYERLSNRAQVIGPASAPARITWEAVPGQTNVVETPLLTLDRAKGRVTAKDGVHAEMVVSRGGQRGSGFGGKDVSVGRGLVGATLSIHTDHPIVMDLVRTGRGMRPKLDSEQVIRIDGPVRTELRSDDRVVDRMRSKRLEVRLIYSIEPTATRQPPSVASARAGGAGKPTPRRRDDRREPARLERVVVDARSMRADLQAGKLLHLQADGKVDLVGEDGRVSGDRLIYDARTGRVHVHGSSPNWRQRPAVAWLGRSDQRTEIQAKTLSMTWLNGAASQVEASVPDREQAGIHLYRQDPKKPGQLEWYFLTYWGKVTMSSDLLQAGRVRIIRRLREPGAKTWRAPTVLWAPTLRVIGSNLLTADERLRDLRRVIAEGANTTFKSGAGKSLVEVWGQRFDFDVHARQATLTGTPGQDVTFQSGGSFRSDQIKIVIDMNTNLPAYISGSRILWSPKERK